MIEKTVLNYLNSYGPVVSYMERPETAPPEYALIEKTGSTTEDQITTSTIAVQAYAKTLLRAAVLSNDIVDAMNNLPQYADDVAGVHLNSEGNFTNTAAKQYRYQAVFIITHY